jgi:hypothetical protein
MCHLKQLRAQFCVPHRASGIGELLATLITLGTVAVSRFAAVGNLYSYCRCVNQCAHLKQQEERSQSAAGSQAVAARPGELSATVDRIPASCRTSLSRSFGNVTCPRCGIIQGG